MGSQPLILLDTQSLYWLDAKLPMLGAVARTRIEAESARGTVAVSAISFWEVAMLMRDGRIALAVTLPAWRADLLRAGLVELPVDGKTGIASVTLEWQHKDPADRLIVATALLHDAMLVTSDERILRWDGPLQSLDARS